MTRTRITLIAVALVTALALSSSGQTGRRHPDQAVRTMPPDADAARVIMYPAGTPDAAQAADEIGQALLRHGCQLEVHRRAMVDGTERTVIIIQQVQYPIGQP